MDLFFKVQNVNGFVLQRLTMKSSCGCQHSKTQSEVVWGSETGLEEGYQGYPFSPAKTDSVNLLFQKTQ